MAIKDLTPDQQFQAFALRRTIDLKVVHAEKMLKDFGVRVLIESISSHSNERRADLVQKATGIKRNSALKLSVDDSIKSIELALAESDTDADELFDTQNEPKGISEEEIIRFFPADRLFSLWFYSGFVTAEGPEDRALMAELYDFILEHKLLGEMTALDLFVELGEQISDKCPKEKRWILLQTIIQYGEPMLSKARPDGSSSSANSSKARPFAAADLFKVITPADLSKFLRLSDMSRPIESLAKSRGWLKITLPAGALDSEAPPAPQSSSVSDPPPPGSAEDEDLDAMLDGDGDGVQVVIDPDDESTATDGSDASTAKPLSKKEQRRQARAGG